jgi:hypothetical protein
MWAKPVSIVSHTALRLSNNDHLSLKNNDHHEKKKSNCGAARDYEYDPEWCWPEVCKMGKDIASSW